MIRRIFSIFTSARASSPRRAVIPPDMDSGLSGSVTDDMIQRLWTPQEAESVLNGAMSGDLSQQNLLFTGMMDTWHKLADNVRTVEDAVVAAPWELLPATGPDGEVSPAAQAKRDLVWKAWRGMRPDPCEAEMGADATLKLFARGCLTGHSVAEVLWERREGVIVPRAIRRTGPRWYGYQGQTRRLRFRPDGAGSWVPFPDSKFLISIVTAHDGHPSQAARLRVLAKYWSGSTYGWEWLMVFANKFGTPFRLATYKKENSNIKANLIAMLGNLGMSGYGAFPEGTKVELIEAGRSAGDLPQALLMKLADQACDLVIRGEVTSGGTGERQGFSNGDVQDGVRRSAMQGYANEIACPLNQLARHIIMLNYGEDTECPTWSCEFPEPEDAKLNAETDEILLRMGLPIKIDELQRRHDKSAPAPGESVLWKGEVQPWAGDPEAPAAPITAALHAARETNAGPTLAEVMERLLINAVIDGAAAFDSAAEKAPDPEEKEETA